MNTRGGASATLKKRERNGWIFCFLKTSKKLYKTFFWANCSFFVIGREKWAIHSKKRAIHSFALLCWATWANHWHSLICHEQPEQFAHFSSAIWANEQMIDEQMSDEQKSKFPTLDIINVLQERIMWTPGTGPTTRCWRAEPSSAGSRTLAGSSWTAWASTTGKVCFTCTV